jgi:hypothetical protein
MWAAFGGWKTAIRVHQLVVVAATGSFVIALPFLLNRRWFSRKLLTAKGLVKAVGLYGLFWVAGTLAGPLGGFWRGISKNMLPRLTQGPTSTTVDVGNFWAFPLLGVLVYAIWGETTLGGSPESFRNRSFSWPRFAWAALGGMVVGITTYAASSAWVAYIFPKMDLLSRGALGFLGEMTTMGYLGWKRLHLGYSLAFLPMSAFLASLWVALSPSPRRRRTRVLSLGIAVLPGLALLGLGAWFQNYCDDRGEMCYSGLAQAARLENAAGSRVMVLPTASGFKAFEYPMVVETVHKERIVASLQNVVLASRYLEERNGRWTAHTGTAWEARASMMDALLEPAKALTYYVEGAEQSNDVLMASLAAVRAARSPDTPLFREAAARLLDERRFVAGGVGRAHQARLAARLGDVPRSGPRR